MVFNLCLLFSQQHHSFSWIAKLALHTLILCKRR
nr:MAG TPA: hypothetical protein [Caudoviricetes sp.]